MSDGSMDYLHVKIAEVADNLCLSEIVERQNFGRHLYLVAQALQAIEFTDSGLRSAGTELVAIAAVIQPREQETTCFFNAVVFHQTGNIVNESTHLVRLDCQPNEITLNMLQDYALNNMDNPLYPNKKGLNCMIRSIAIL